MFSDMEIWCDFPTYIILSLRFVTGDLQIMAIYLGLLDPAWQPAGDWGGEREEGQSLLMV